MIKTAECATTPVNVREHNSHLQQATIPMGAHNAGLTGSAAN